MGTSIPIILGLCIGLLVLQLTSSGMDSLVKTLATVLCGLFVIALLVNFVILDQLPIPTPPTLAEVLTIVFMLPAAGVIAVGLVAAVVHRLRCKPPS